MARSYEQIAYTLILMLKRSEKARFRISRKTLQEISGRDVIRTALITNIAEWMEGRAVIAPLNRGGYVVLSQESLEGIAPLKVGDVIPDWKKLTMDDLYAELDDEEDDDDS